MTAKEIANFFERLRKFSDVVVAFPESISPIEERQTQKGGYQ